VCRAWPPVAYGARSQENAGIENLATARRWIPVCWIFPLICLAPVVEENFFPSVSPLGPEGGLRMSYQ